MQTKIMKTAASAILALTATAIYAQGDPQDQGTPQGQGISVTVDGRPINFRGTPPQMMEGRVLVPLRGIFERLGAYVQWNPGQHEVIATRGHNSVELQIGNPQATVDGRQVSLDVPAQIVDGATMVPIRFVSESLGADVHWQEAQQLVVIMSGHGRAEAIAAPAPWHAPAAGREVLERNSIIPVTLDQPLSSDRARRGEHFTATVRYNGAETYGFLPAGTKVSGLVITAEPRRGNEPGMLELQFNRMELPDGSVYPIDGRLIGLNDPNISREQGGLLMARGAAVTESRRVFAGIGPDGRNIVVWGPTIERTNPRNVELEAGTELGVRLRSDVAIRGRDLHR